MFSKKIVFLALAALALLLSACTRSASQAPQATPTIENFPQPVAATPGMGLIEDLATQTAVAMTPGAAETLAAAPTQAPAEAGVATATVDLIGLATLPPVATSGAASTAVPSPTPAAALPVAPVAVPGTYTLQLGEFPYCIARRFNLNPDTLLAANPAVQGIPDYSIPAGTVLTIPQNPGTFPGTRALVSHPATYTVLAGETIYGIACKFGDVDPLSIAAKNNLVAPYKLTAGAQIAIP